MASTRGPQFRIVEGLSRAAKFLKFCCCYHSVHVAGGNVDNAESNIRESISCLAMDIKSADVVEKSAAINHLINDEDTAFEVIEFASSLMSECKAGLPFSDLDTSVILCHQVLNSRAATHNLHTDAMRSLASVLGIKFMYTNHLEDLVESIVLRLQTKLGQFATQNTHTFINQGFEDETEETSKLANGMLTNFRMSTSLHALNTVVFLIDQSLPHLSSNSKDARTKALITLVDALYARFNLNLETAASDLNTAISTLQDAIRYCFKYDGERRTLYSRLCCLFVERFDLTGDSSDLQRASTCLKNCDPRDPTDTLPRLQLAAQMYARSTETGDRDELDGAVTLFREVVAKLPQEHENWTVAISNLAAALFGRYAQGHDQNDLEEAISLNRKVLGCIPPAHPNQGSCLYNLAAALWTRFEQGGSCSDLDEAIVLNREALELFNPPHPNRSTCLNNLANALSTRFELGGQHNDLDDAISFYRQVLKLPVPVHPDRSIAVNNLASALLTRFRQGGQPNDINEAIDLHMQALEMFPASHSNRSTSLNNVGIALWTRFEHAGQRSDLAQAISFYKQALELRHPLHPKRCNLLNNLASALLTRFKLEGQQSDLDEAISLNQQARDLRLHLNPRSDQSNSLNNLANALRIRFEQRGQQSDLDDAISFHRQALALRLPPHPNRSTSLNNLATALTFRYRQSAQCADIDETISLYKQALQLQPALHPKRSDSLNNLALALISRFEREGNHTDLLEAVSLHKQALELRPPPHPKRSGSLFNLAIALSTPFEIGQLVDHDEIIGLHRQAKELRPPHHPDYCSSLNALGVALSNRYAQTGDAGNLEEAICLHRQVVDLCLPPHPIRSESLNNLAAVLLQKFRNGKQQIDLDEAMTLFAAAAQDTSQAPSHRFRIAKTWIRNSEQHQHTSSIAAYETALRTLPQVAALSLDVASRQTALAAGSDGLARDASRRAILSGNTHKAIELLEAGRSVFWSQALSLRSPFDQLRQITPNGLELANRLQNIANALETGSYRNVSADILDNERKLSIDQEASRMNRLNEEWASTILEVQKLTGFENFMSPPSIDSLRVAASKNPVVLLVANDDASHCLIMTSTEIHHIPLPNLRTPVLKILVYNIRAAVCQSMLPSPFIHEVQAATIELFGRERGISYQGDNNDPSDDIFRFVLKMLWDELAKPVIDRLDIKKSGTMPTLQWCPTGYFTFLPIHAAGCYDDNLLIDCSQDYFISSYVPTVGTLLVEPSSTPSQKLQVMAVIQPQELPSTKEELTKIKQYVPRDALIELGVPGSPTSVEGVASRLSSAAIVHFACHGTQDPFQPLDSGLKLDDGLLRISRIMQEKIPNGSLAFLGACETAMGDQSLPDEAMSLAASLLFAGFRRVVATMWAMMDKDGPTVADVFYRELFRGHGGKQSLEPDVSKSAYALHCAVKELRSQNVSFRRWVPFIHMGQ